MELRHLRYFTAVVKWDGYREASRHLHIAQPSISQTVADLERELGLRLFSRAGRRVVLTPVGEAFYIEAVRTLEQAESAVNTAKRAAKGEIGKLSIGYIGSATYAFLPALLRNYKAQYPGVKLTLQELSPFDQEAALEQGSIDVGFTRTLQAEKGKTLSSRSLYRDPLLAVLPASRKVKTKSVRIADLAGERFVLFDREGSPVLFDTILRICNEAGFIPRIENESDRPQTILSLVEAEEGVSIVPACVRNLWSRGVQFHRLQPDDARIALVAAWKKEASSTALRTFLDLMNTNVAHILKKAELSVSLRS
jgi:DNA-binding transcriptional LysR family regulator